VDVRPEVARILSGGQTGVDRAALDFAIAAGLEYGGWCPRGGWAEDATLPPGVLGRYPLLRETPSGDRAQRTLWNVRDADATLILVGHAAQLDTPGTRLTRRWARELGRPLAVVVALGDEGAREQAATVAARAVEELLAEMPAGGGALNVAGPRESEAPGIERVAGSLLEQLLLSPPRDRAAARGCGR
jgi:hypothetical protein